MQIRKRSALQGVIVLRATWSFVSIFSYPPLLRGDNDLNLNPCVLAEEYELAADDCTFVLAGRGPIASKSITLKAHLRLARSLQGLGKLDKALAELDRFRALNGGVSQAAEVKTRSQILEQQAAQDRATNERIEGGPPMRSIRYDVRAGPFPPIVINEQAPVVICGPNPPEMPAKMFLAALVKKHDPAIMRSRDWMCWNCEKKAASMVHTPCSYLHLADPFIVDYVQPICENRGQCEKEARDFIAQQMTDIARVGRTS